MISARRRLAVLAGCWAFFLSPRAFAADAIDELMMTPLERVPLQSKAKTA